MAVQISGNDITVPRDGTFSRNVSIAGTLTYEDVTNVDSIGLVTARNGIEVGASPGVAASISVDGNMIVSGITTIGGVVNASSDIKVGSGVTVGKDGDIFATGVTTSTTVKVGAAVTISESGIEASGIGITCANLNGGQFGRRNLIINGAMQVAQRGNVSSVTDGYGGADRFKFTRSGAAAVTLRQQGVGNSPTDKGFGFSHQIDVTTADSSLAAGDYALISYRFEGQDLQQLKKGTSNAQQVTLSFYIKSPKTGTHIVELVDQSNSGRHVNKAYTVSSANTWEKKTVTFPMETSNTITNDNARRMDLNWWLAAGSTYSSGSLQTSWGADTDANRAVGQVNCMDSTDNNVYITGVQLELGSQATAFEHRSLAEELALCRRYYQQYTNIVATGYASDSNNTSYHHGFTFPVEMRSAPTYSITNTGSTAGQYVTDGNNNVSISSLSGGDFQTHNMAVHYNLTGDLTNFSAAHLFGVDSTTYQTTHKLTAEL